MDSTFRPALTLSVGKVLAFTATFFIPVILVRIFSQSDFGTYKQIFLIFSTVYLIAQFGMAESLFYFVPSMPQQSGRLIANSMLMLGLTGFLSGIGLIVARPWIAHWFNNGDLAEYLTLLGWYVLLMIICSALEIVTIARKEFSLGSMIYAASDVTRAVLFIGLAVLGRDLKWLLWGAILLAVVRACLLLFYLIKRFGPALRVDVRLLKNQLGYAVPFGTAVVFEILNTNYHQYAVSHLFDAAQFAIYSVGCMQIPLVDFLASPLASVLMVRMSETIHQGKSQQLIPIWHDAVRKLSFFFFPLVAWLLLISHELIITLYKENFEASVPIFMVWTTTILLAVFQSDSVLRVYAQTRFLLALKILALTTNVCAIGFAISHFHMMGAVMTSVTVSLISKSLGLSRIKKLLHVSFAQLIPWKWLALSLGVAFLSTLPGVLLRAVWHLPNLASLAVSSLTLGAAYLGLLYGLNLLTEEERQEIRAKVHLAAGLAQTRRQEIRGRLHRIVASIQEARRTAKLKANAADRGSLSPDPLVGPKGAVNKDLTEFP